MVSNPRNFKRPGTAEYVLAHAKLITVASTREDDVLTAGSGMASLFRTDATPVMNVVAEAMLSLVTSHALEQSGFLDATTMKMQAVAALREQGITEAGLFDLQRSIEKSAQAVKQERAKSVAKAM